jgi:hypothetical protein
MRFVERLKPCRAPHELTMEHTPGDSGIRRADGKEPGILGGTYVKLESKATRVSGRRTGGRLLAGSVFANARANASGDALMSASAGLKFWFGFPRLVPCSIPCLYHLVSAKLSYDGLQAFDRPRSSIS